MGDKYIGIDLDWNYDKRELTTVMKGYAQKALLQFKHKSPTRPYHSPSQYITPKYGAKTQYTKIDDSTPMTETEKHYLQQICDKFLYYARAVDDTMLHVLNDLAVWQTNGTLVTLQAMLHFLNYADAHPDAKTSYKASNVILSIDSDVAYLVAPQAIIIIT